MTQWEYLTTFLEADALSSAALAALGYDPKKLPKHSPLFLKPELDQYGQQGWELVSLEPVARGSNGDVWVQGAGGAAAREWSYTYLAVFKRPKS